MVSDEEQLQNGEADSTEDLKALIGKALDDQLEEVEPDEEEPEAEAAEEGDEPEAEELLEEEPEPEAEPEEEPFAAPHHYSEEDKQVFSDLPREKQEWLLAKAKATDDSHAQRMEELANVRKEQADIVEAFKPVEQLLIQNGMDRVTAVRRLVGAQTHLMTNPGEALALLASTYVRDNPQEAVRKVAAALNVQLEGSAGSEENGEDYLDPALAKRVSQLDQHIRKLESTTQTQAQASKQAQVAQAQQAIDSFRTAVDEKGNPLHPHFEKVQNLMATFLSNGISTSMEDAYKRAVMADPELSEALIKQRLEQSAEQRESERKKALEKAKKASRNVTGDRTPAEKPKTAPKSTKDAIRAAVDQWDTEHAG